MALAATGKCSTLLFLERINLTILSSGLPAAIDTTKTERTSTPATMGTSNHEHSASNFEPADDSFTLGQMPDGFDADVGPYDPDNDYFPE